MSVRNVATEAGLSAGSVRHYFATQSDLLTFTMQLVIDRVRDRVRQGAADRDPDPRVAVRQVIDELLPLDEDRRAEAEVWFAFTAFAQTEPRLRAVRDESYQQLEGLCRDLATALAGDARHLDPAVESERLYALIDGLVLHCVVRPDRATPELMHAVVDRHLEELARSAAAG